MPAFGASPLTPTRTHDPSRDGTTPQCRSLSLGGMCNPGALPGTTGTHTEVITGDWQQKIQGSAKVAINGNSDTTVQGNSGTTVHGDATEHFNQNQTTTVSSNLKQKVLGNSTTVVNGTEHSTTIGPTLETKIGEHTQVHQSSENNQDFWHVATHWFQHDVFLERFEADGVLICPIGFHGDLVGARITAGVALNDFRVWGNHFKGLHTEEHGLDSRLDGMADAIKDLQADITPVTIRVHPVRLISTGLYVIAGPPVIGSILDALIAEFALAAAI